MFRSRHSRKRASLRTVGGLAILAAAATGCRAPIPDGAFGAIPTGTNCSISWLEPSDWNFGTGDGESGAVWAPLALAMSLVPLPVCANS